jgi:hypothetical protein
MIAKEPGFTLNELKDAAFDLVKRLTGREDFRLQQAVFEALRGYATDWDEEIR